MAFLQAETMLQTVYENTVELLECVQSFPELDIWNVRYRDEIMQMKWYRQDGIGNNPMLYQELVQKISNGAPHPAFLWPIDITENFEEGFGCVFSSKPDGYLPLSRFGLNDKYNFGKYSTNVKLCMNIVSAFKALHDVGCAREVFSEDDFFVEPTSGDVKISFDDGLQHIRDIRFTSPELIVGGNEEYDMIASEKFAVYIIVFMLLTSNHPFEGKEWLSKPYISDEDAFKLYGTPVFIFESDNDANRPSDGIQSNVKEIWAQFPEYIKNVFQTVFGEESIKNPSSRLNELTLLEALAHFSCDIIKCKCGNEMIYNGDATVVCPLCKRPTEIKHKIELSAYSVPAVTGTVIYRGQINSAGTGDFSLEKLFLVVARPDNSGALGLKNVSGEVFSVTTASGQKLPLVPQKPVPLGAGAGLVIDVDGYEVKLS